MKTLVFNNSDSTKILQYEVDLIGNNDAMTIYQIKQIISGVETVIKNTGGNTNMDSTLVGLGFPDQVTESSKATFVALADTVNYTLKVYETGQDVVTLHTLS